MITKYEKANKGKLLVAVLALFVVLAGAAVVFSDSDINAANNDTQYYSGVLDKTQEFSTGANVIIDKDLTIRTNSEADTDGLLLITGATLTINEGVTITIENGGTVLIDNTSTVIVNGSIVVKTGGMLYNAASEYNSETKAGALTVNGSIEIQRGGTFDAATHSAETATPSDGSTVGNVIISAEGTIKSLSTKATASAFNNQIIVMSTGATLDINSTTKNVTVNADYGTGVHTYGEVAITAEAGTQTATSMNFSVTSERITDAYLDDEKYSRATSYVLDISGTIGAYTTVTVNDTVAVGGTLELPNATGNATSDVPIVGVVSVSDTLRVGANATFVADANSMLNISGTVNVAGEKATDEGNRYAEITLSGTVNVSGQVLISETLTENTNDSTALVKLTIENTAIVNIVDEGTVSIDDYTLDTKEWKNAPSATHGVSYYDKDGTFHLTSFQKAIDGAVAENYDMTVSVWGYDAISGKALSNPYTIEADATIPADITVEINTVVAIAEGVTVTVPEDASLSSATSSSATSGAGKLTVDGQLKDYTMSAAESGFVLIADVMSMDADQTYNLYTNLKNALSTANEGDVIDLYGTTVDVDGIVTIPAGVTVQVGTGHTLTVNNNSTLVVDGTIYAEGTITVTGASGNDKAGVITVNNMIVDDNATVPALDGFYATGEIGDYTASGLEFILAPQVAADNSSTLDTIEVKGKVTYNGELSFTAGEDAVAATITVSGNDVSISKIVTDGFTVNITTGTFTGTIEMNVTVGASAITFDKATNYKVYADEDDSGETTVTKAYLDKSSDSTTSGKVTIATGSYELVKAVGFGTSRANTLTISSGATLVVPEGLYINVYAPSTEEARFDYSAVTVDGTLSFVNAGNSTANAGSKPVTINGTLSIVGDYTIPANMTMIVNGTVAVSEIEGQEGLLTVGGKLFVGTATDSLGTNGTITGPVDIAEENIITVYSGSSVEAEKLNVNNGESAAVSTEFYINGTLYMTVYAYGTVAIDDTFLTGFNGFPIIGYSTTTATDASNWYTTPGYENGTALDANAEIGAEGYTAVYYNATAKNVTVQVSIGPQISIYIDDVRVTENKPLTVGEHTIVATVNPGYTGDVTISFNGQTITDGKIVITPEMVDGATEAPVLSVTGNLSYDLGNTDSGNGGMGIVEILLVILVVVVVILAIIVVLRMMRS